MPAGKELFEKYPNAVFIETGAGFGSGINEALLSGFKRIYSLELSPTLLEQCRKRFEEVDNVQLLLGDSPVLLKELISTIDEPITFWLDAHYSYGDTALGDCISPLLKELEVIKNHPIKTHTILIDDLRDWNIKQHGFDTEMLIQKCLEINPLYKISLVADDLSPVDVLVATP